MQTKQIIPLLKKLRAKNKQTFALQVILALLIILYIIGIIFYQNHYLPNTFAAGVPIGNRDQQEAIAEVKSKLGQEVVDFQEGGKDLGFVQLNQFELDYPNSFDWQEGLAKQWAWAWPIQILRGNRQLEAQPSLLANDSQVDQLIQGLGIDNSQREATQNARLTEAEDGSLQVIEEKYGNNIDSESMRQALAQGLSQGLDKIDLKTAYKQPKYTKDGKGIQDLQADYQAKEATQITLEFNHESVTIPQDQIKAWLHLDDQGQAQVDQEAIKDYIYQLNETYSSLFGKHEFQSTYQGLVTVESGTFGWYIDPDAEAPVIAENILKGGSYKREPAIAGQGYMAENEIGNSYVEVDLSHQMMLVYLEGALVLETPIVSGNIGTLTVPGAYQVWQKLEKTDLRGYNPRTEKEYVQPVDYWIAFDNNGQGIHDAQWQSQFGGNVYQSSGSLGCINTPLSAMQEVFQIVYVGMPVMIF